MKIGLLAYHSVNNFGAKLQLLSTYCYFRNCNIETVIINWVPKDLEHFYVQNDVQTVVNFSFRKKYWNETSVCRNAKEIAEVIKQEGITAVVIGSDAVAQHHPLFERIRFSKKKLFCISHPTSDRMFPNPFWGEFNNYLNNKIPIAVISASSQDSDYHLFSYKTRKQMYNCIKEYCFLSARDPWTQKMYQYISCGSIVPKVTPDPVFGFNMNAANILPERQEILSKFGLNEKYVLASFRKPSCVSQKWIDLLKIECNKRHLQLVSLPFSDETDFGEMDKKIEYPISPLDWYSLIKYSNGYIGNNMHPIVVSLHNCIPFYSFDNYGSRRLFGTIKSDKSSKIKHIVSISGLTNNRVSCISRRFTPPTPEKVVSAIINFDYEKCASFAKAWTKEYGEMMSNVVSILQNKDIV